MIIIFSIKLTCYHYTECVNIHVAPQSNKCTVYTLDHIEKSLHIFFWIYILFTQFVVLSVNIEVWSYIFYECVNGVNNSVLVYLDVY